MRCRLDLFRYTFILLFSVSLMIAGCAAFTPLERPAVSGDELIIWMSGAVSVQVIGDWNEWGGIESAGGICNPTEGSMIVDEAGVWRYEITSELSAGRYRYAFLVNGCEIIGDPENPETAVYNGITVSVLVITH